MIFRENYAFHVRIRYEESVRVKQRVSGGLQEGMTREKNEEGVIDL
jgi:hypothetical protein